MPQYLQFSVYFSNKALVNSSSRIYSCFRTVRSFWVSLWHSTVCFMFKTSAGLACIHLNVVSVFIKLGPVEQAPGLIHTEGVCVLNVHIMYMSIYECVFDRMYVGRVSEWTGDQREPQCLHDSFIDHTHTVGTCYRSRWVGNWGLAFILNGLLL